MSNLTLSKERSTIIRNKVMISGISYAFLISVASFIDITSPRLLRDVSFPPLDPSSSFNLRFHSERQRIKQTFAMWFMWIAIKSVLKYEWLNHAIESSLDKPKVISSDNLLWNPIKSRESFTAFLIILSWLNSTGGRK